MIAGARKSILLNRDFQIDYSDWTTGKCWYCDMLTGTKAHKESSSAVYLNK